MRDLAKVDRKKTPWLIAYFHAPIVTCAWRPRTAAAPPRFTACLFGMAAEGVAAHAPTSQTHAAARARRRSYEASFKQVECMRLTYEPLLYRVRLRSPSAFSLPLGWLYITHASR